MRVLVDALGALERSGGMRVLTVETLRAWSSEFPDDELIVLAPQWLLDEVGSPNVRGIRWPNASIMTRAPGQLIVSGIAAAARRADALVSLGPVVSPLTRRPRVCFNHDWRHLANPHEFGRGQRLYRKIWRASAGWADAVACLSAKTLRETRAVQPRAKAVIVAPGWDDARRWMSASTSIADRAIVTFGHHTNKHPELILAGYALLGDEVSKMHPLVIFGAQGTQAEQLRAAALEHGLADRVMLPGFVDDATFQATFIGASVVALATTDEGFGLPLSQALALGIPAMASTASGASETFGGAVDTFHDDPRAVAATLFRALSAPRPVEPPDVRTWAEAARDTRALVGTLVEPAAERPHA